jgi:hypothetical protein
MVEEGSDFGLDLKKAWQAQRRLGRRLIEMKSL